jgi:hypothetical protein
MSNIILSIILIVLTVGIIVIKNVLNKIKKVREESTHDYRYVKEIITFLGRKNGFFDGKD